MKKQFIALSVLLSFACSHTDKKSEAASTCTANTVKPERANGYGDFLFIPPDSIAIRNFVDKDNDKIDDRYQLAPGQPGLPMGYFYKKTK